MIQPRSQLEDDTTISRPQTFLTESATAEEASMKLQNVFAIRVLNDSLYAADVDLATAPSEGLLERICQAKVCNRTYTTARELFVPLKSHSVKAGVIRGAINCQCMDIGAWMTMRCFEFLPGAGIL